MTNWSIAKAKEKATVKPEGRGQLGARAPFPGPASVTDSALTESHEERRSRDDVCSKMNPARDFYYITYCSLLKKSLF